MAKVTSKGATKIPSRADRKRAFRVALITIAGEAGKKFVKAASTVSTTQELKNSVISVPTQRGVEVTASGYAEIALETGRRPGTQPPAEALKRWARLKLGNEKAAYAVAKKIAERGTRKHQRGGPKLITQIEKEMDVFIGKTLDNLLDSYI